MKNYSIVRMGTEYIVQADEKSILKIASRRRAAKLISDATELLEQQIALSLDDDDSSNGREPDSEPESVKFLDDPGASP